MSMLDLSEVGVDKGKFSNLRVPLAIEKFSH